MSTTAEAEGWTGLELAIIGMSGRFPGAPNLDAYWALLRDGVEAIAAFSDEELLADGVEPELLEQPNYVRAAAVLDGIDRFDAEFFGYNPKEAAAMDPQGRIFLETAWAALEDAGYDPGTYGGAIGVYAGAGVSSYLLHAYADPSLSQFLAVIANDKDFLTTRVSYKLNLRGPSIDVQTACSTSLVAVHLACQGLLSGECDMALAGGVAVKVPHRAGYLYQEGGILAPDGHCRAFDAQAHGTVLGNGVGVVVLKRLEDALRDGDTIHAVIKGTAINNDGALKVGYTAPSVDGQAAVIAAAQLLASVEPRTIGYVEAHGTGTVLGDPIELAALSQVFRARTTERQFCAIGSVKTNLGHLDTAAGVAGLIKVVLALKHGALPPSLHYTQPNPKIDFASSPFYVNSSLAPWAAEGAPRRAAVSSFGIGGTNAHAILEEAPASAPSGPARPWHVLLLSARSPGALDAASANLAAHLRHDPDGNLADLAYTLQVGRAGFAHRRAVVCHEAGDALAALEARGGRGVLEGVATQSDRPVVFLFPGQGAQYAGMARGLYASEPVFREVVDRCAELLSPQLGLDLREVLFPDEAGSAAATERLTHTAITQPALFTVEYALARLWMAWGVTPEAMIGHSVGEYIAACLADVLSLEDALTLIAARGRLMGSLPGGAMLSVPLPEEQARRHLDDTLALAAVNAPELCVISGPEQAVAAYARRLAAQGVTTQPLHTSHAFHSPMMDPIVEPFTGLVGQVALKPPRIPFISNLSGTWITDAEATDPAYWASHLRRTVRFSDGLAELLREPARALLEVGPGHTLSTFARRQAAGATAAPIVASLRHPHETRADEAVLLEALGQLWVAGVRVDWPGFSAHERRRRVSLPTYPFQRQRYWLDAPRKGQAPRPTDGPPGTQRPLSRWFYARSWERAPRLKGQLRKAETAEPQRWLVLLDGCPLAHRLADGLRRNGHEVLTAVPGADFAELHDGAFRLDPADPASFDALLARLTAQDRLPDQVVYAWPLEEGSCRRSCDGLLFLARSLGRAGAPAPTGLTILTTHAENVGGDEPCLPEQALLPGLRGTIEQEQIVCRSVDLALPVPGSWQEAALVEQLIGDLAAMASEEATVAYRGATRWVGRYTPLELGEASTDRVELREGGVYLIVGGLDGFGLVLAEALARAVGPRLALALPGPFPARDAWENWLAQHGDANGVSRAMHAIQAIEAAGSSVLVVDAAADNRAALEAALAATYNQFGALHGVFYTPGGAGEAAFLSIEEAAEAGSLEPLLADLAGLATLADVLPREGLDFCALNGSLAPILGGIGLAGQGAIGAAMASYAHAASRTHAYPWHCIAWEHWQVAGGQGLAGQAELAIAPHEGIAALERLLRAGLACPVAIVPTDLPARMEARRARDATATAVAAAGEPHHGRPNLPNPFVAPRNELEATIAAIWQELLGIKEIGVYDNFFALGGHSLLIAQVVARLRDAFPVEVPLRRLFDAQTVADLAVVLVQLLAEQQSVGELDELLAELELLSADDARPVAEASPSGQEALS